MACSANATLTPKAGENPPPATCACSAHPSVRHECRRVNRRCALPHHMPTPASRSYAPLMQKGHHAPSTFTSNVRSAPPKAMQVKQASQASVPTTQKKGVSLLHGHTLPSNPEGCPCECSPMHHGSHTGQKPLPHVQTHNHTQPASLLWHHASIFRNAVVHCTLSAQQQRITAACTLIKRPPGFIPPMWHAAT